jgi:hypothetical protein
VAVYDSLKTMEKAMSDWLADKKGARGFEDAQDVMQMGRELGLVL